MAVELTDKFFAGIAGWDAVKQARSLLAGGKVLSSNWTPPVLKGVVQEGSVSYRAGLVIKNERDVENICTCRSSREWGTICAHSVGVGLHHLRRSAPSAPETAPTGTKPAAGKSTDQAPNRGKRIRRVAPCADGEPAEIHIILPPNLAPALERGKVMLCLEGGWRGGRVPLNALPAGRPFRFSEQDSALLDAVETLAGGDTPALLMLNARDFADLLPVLTEHPRLTLGKSAPAKVIKEPWPLALTANLEPDGEIVLRLKSSAALAVIEGKWVFQDGTLQPLALPESCRGILRGPVRFTRTCVPQFLGGDWPQLLAAGSVKANFSIEDFALAPASPRFLLHLAGGIAQLHAQLQCAYGPRIMTVGVTSPDEAVWLPDPDSPTRYSTRDLPTERAALGRLLRYGFHGPDSQGRFLLAGQDRVLNFFAREFPRLEKEWEVTLEERLERSAERNLERIEPRFEITSSGVQWFDLGVAFEASDGQRLAPADIQRLLLAGQGHTRLRNGKFALIDTGAVEELQEVLLDCAPQQQEGKYRLRQTQAGFLEATLRAQGWQAQAPADWLGRARLQSGEAKWECPPLGDLDGVLRPYQKDGVGWLHFLRANGFGGILADEMGLGKTLQALAFLQTLAPGAVSPSATALVICPTSLVFNWTSEARRFTPHLKVLALQGPDRHRWFEQIPRHHLVVTSYALMRRDLERYREFDFDTVILDEAQHIKNRQTQNAQAVKAVRSRHRLVLTGTPLENSVLDLWSIFDFLMPGYLGSAKDFRERYELPITREKNAAAQARLARRLRPFLLRRLKKDVAQELPPKLEQIAYCELTEDQRAVYMQLLEAGRREVFETVAGHGTGRGRMVALTALLRLRQVCCDLRLLKLERPAAAVTSAGVSLAVSPGGGQPWSEEARSQESAEARPADGGTSGKLELFSELLEEVLDGGHRVLVFSQFVSALALLRERLAAEGVDYCYLDGSTADRAAVVTRFQRTEVPVFLISLKAGGVGLNLSGADTVIHFDPWWNPAVEDQATDRAHRIGQTRVVTSYKLITRGTVEEKIVQLQERKREITQAMLGGEEQLMSALSWEEIQDLFAP